MSLRLLEAYLPGVEGERLKEILEERPLVSLWYEELPEGVTQAKILLGAEESEGVIDLLNQHFGSLEGFRLLLLQVEATFPRVEETKEVKVEKQPPQKWIRRVSLEEMYEDITQAATLTPTFVLLVILSAIVATLGVFRGDLILLIGAMVIAPLFGPNAALALAATLGDRDLAMRALRASLVGFGLAVGVGILFGLLISVNVGSPLVQARTRVDFWDILLAVAAGSAGAISFSIVLPSALVGVMVAVALLPPTVILGMLLGAGHLQEAAGTGLLLGVYVVSINLAGVLTFLVQGIRPMSWWEAERAKSATRVSMTVWMLLLLVLGFLVFLNLGR